MIDFLYRLFFGWVEVTLVGRHPEEIISQLALSGQRLWAVKNTSKGYRFIAPLSSLPILRQVLRGKHYHLHFGRRGGLPFKWRQFTARPFLGVGALTAVALIFVTTSRIWIINVPTANITPTAKTQLIQAAKAAGIHVGTPSRAINLSKSRLIMQRILPQYAFIGLSLHGVLLTVQVVPLVTKPSNKLPRKMIAAHSGTVTSVLVYMGDPEVSPGEVVEKGQTLISGAVSAPVPIQPEGATKPLTDAVQTPARGEVYADVRYQATVVQPYQFHEWVPSGHTFTQTFIQIGDNAPVLLQGYGSIPFRSYKTHKFVEPWRWQDVNLPVETVKIVYNELQRRRVMLSRKQALARAIDHVSRRMHNMVHGGTKVRERRIIHWSNHSVSVQLIWVVNQNIAVPVTN